MFSEEHSTVVALALRSTDKAFASAVVEPFVVNSYSSSAAVRWWDREPNVCTFCHYCGVLYNRIRVIGRREGALCVKPRFVAGALCLSATVIVMVRVGIHVPIVTNVANPLLSEGERTYQLERALAWLHSSNYCGL